MSIVLSVVIPYFKEKPERIFPLLASLNGQVGVNFSEVELIMVDGGAHNLLPEEFLLQFENLSPLILHMDSDEGPGVSRQTGLDAAAGEYVMFCDADDILFSVEVLRHFIAAIKRQGEPPADMFWSPWYEEVMDLETSNYSYFLHENNETWLHGRAFLRSFLTKRSIRFHEKLRSHEDTYFMTLVESEAKDMRRLDEISYIWKFHAESVTRRNNNAAYAATMLDHIQSLSYALGTIAARRSERIAYLTVDTIMYYYFALHEHIWQLPENAELLHQTEQALRSMIKRHMPYFTNAPQDFIATLYSRQRTAHKTHELGTETLFEWLSRLKLYV